MKFARTMTETEKNAILCVVDDIKVGQDTLYDNDILYDEDEFKLERAREALAYGVYNDNICYIMEGIDILKEFIQNVIDFEEEDYSYFSGCIIALQIIASKWLAK